LYQKRFCYKNDAHATPINHVSFSFPSDEKEPQKQTK